MSMIDETVLDPYRLGKYLGVVRLGSLGNLSRGRVRLDYEREYGKR